MGKVKNGINYEDVIARHQPSIMEGNNVNSASTALNKWLKSRVPEGCVIHSSRHSLRDRLKAVQCPSDMIDQIGGWGYCWCWAKLWRGFLKRRY